MLIAAFQPLTLLDYPNKLAALMFTQGCNFACGYCHNAQMISPCRVNDDPSLSEESILSFLFRRRVLLDGVVVSGGEPTLQEDLQPFLCKLKAMGYLVKLDTNGSRPEVLRHLLQAKLLDYVAMDVKYSPHGYRRFVRSTPLEAFRSSIEILQESDIDYEFRSTILPFYHSRADIEAIGEMVRGSKRWYLQSFRSIKTLHPVLRNERSFSEEELVSFQKIAAGYVREVGIRM